MANRSSIYPLHPPSSRAVVRFGESEATIWDKVVVATSSLAIVGSIAWIPASCWWMYRRYRQVPAGTRRKKVYGALILAVVAIFIAGPHRHPPVGAWLRFRRWKLWDSWMKFLAMEVILDQKKSDNFDTTRDLAIFAVTPHGIFPFPLAFAILPEKITEAAFGVVRPIVASATAFFPIVRDFLKWLNAIDASRLSVHRALCQGHRVALVPGGIAEIFETYPKAGVHANQECAIVRKGFLRMAIQHGQPVVPVYCFGGTKLMRRLDLPILEKLSLLLRISLCIFYGQWGLPIPFRQKLSYVVGNPIYPAAENGVASLDAQVNDMHKAFCDELLRMFDSHKEAYGWAHKTLQIITR